MGDGSDSAEQERKRKLLEKFREREAGSVRKLLLGKALDATGIKEHLVDAAEHLLDSKKHE